MKLLKLTLLLIIYFSFPVFGQLKQEINQLPYQDFKHYSRVFGKEKTYRLYLPDNYLQSDKKYPVVYFFHGWGGRYFKDESAKLEYEKLGTLVNKYQIILVMWDGNIEEGEPRPYNIGDHKDIKFKILMKDYFPELVAHIDSTCRTFNDRQHRGIIGFSMGGFMSFYLAGKYPDVVSAAVNMVGSPEFFIGLPDNHTLYSSRFTFDNLRDVGLLFYNREMCPLSGLNDEVNQGARWSELENYEYHKFPGGHKIDEHGETKVFESAMRFIAQRFEKPVSLHNTWSHYDICDEFNVWNYTVKSNKQEPGFLFLRNVDVNGFGFYTFKWLNDGPPIKNCSATITTAPVYIPGANYEIHVCNKRNAQISVFNHIADKEGRLHIDLTGEGCEVGIVKKVQHPSFVSLNYVPGHGGRFLKVNEEEGLSVSIFNRGGVTYPEGKLRVTLSCADSSVTIPQPVQEISLTKNVLVFKTKPIKIVCKKAPPVDGSPAWLRVKAEMDYGTIHSQDDLLVPVLFDVPYFSNTKVDDGRSVAPTKNQSDYNHTEADSVYGKGNGDGIASAGESILLYENGHRLRVYTDDPYVICNEEKLVDEILPGTWPDGYTLSSVVKIAGNCPEGHEIEFLTHYETKTYMPMYRQVKWGKVKIKTGHKL